MELQLGFSPRSMRLSDEINHLNGKVADGIFSEAQEDTHSSMSESLEENATLVSDEEESRLPIAVGVVVNNVAHLSKDTLILRVTLNEFHRWELDLEPDDKKSNEVQDRGSDEAMQGAEPTDMQGPGDLSHACPCCT